MKLRFLLFYMLLFTALGVTMCVLIARGSSQEDVSYPTEINRLVLRLAENWNQVLSSGTGTDAPPGTGEYSTDGSVAKENLKVRELMQGISQEKLFDYTVIDRDGNLLFASKEGMATSVSAATAHYDVIRNIEVDGKVEGYLLVHNPYLELQSKRDFRQALMIGALLLIMLLLSLGYFLYLRRRVVKPFDKMKSFATRVASGDLETPLEMDRAHVFGAFTESFDIMREELAASREREEAAVRSRKELVAELSHDIKTPVASIKAMADVMSLTAKDDVERETIAAINGKADQIDRLISNLFHATLEELEQLEVRPEDVSSTEILQMIKEADYQKKAVSPVIEDSVVRADRLRLNQVISNIIANSYKYANTEILVRSRFEKVSVQKPDGTEEDQSTEYDQAKDFLVLEISDKGGGVPNNELELITQKFKRGSNAAGKDGSGLGLYISGYFMEKMGGSLECLNQGGGFTVRLKLMLA
ncbi:MAG: HAMP domain-containing histidine kinase [Eubacterium sp.]|nr:HAMP domain-containing histidine kinase [Eubacterium sp.]